MLTHCRHPTLVVRLSAGQSFFESTHHANRSEYRRHPVFARGRHLGPAGHQRPARQFHDWPNEMGDVWRRPAVRRHRALSYSSPSLRATDACRGVSAVNYCMKILLLVSVPAIVTVACGGSTDPGVNAHVRFLVDAPFCSGSYPVNFFIDNVQVGRDTMW